MIVISSAYGIGKLVVRPGAAIIHDSPGSDGAFTMCPLVQPRLYFALLDTELCLKLCEVFADGDLDVSMYLPLQLSEGIHGITLLKLFLGIQTGDVRAGYPTPEQHLEQLLVPPNVFGSTVQIN